MSTSFDRAHPTSQIARGARLRKSAKLQAAASALGARVLRERGLLFLGGVVAFAGVEMTVINHLADSAPDDRTAPVAISHVDAPVAAAPVAARATVAIHHPAVVAHVAMPQVARHPVVAPPAIAAHPTAPKVADRPVVAPLAFRALDDSGADGDLGSFAYAGPWEHVRGIADGRSKGTSTRSYHPGATATLRFAGREVKLIGITGPTGGKAIVQVDGRVGPTVEFYAPAKHVDTVVYASPLLARGDHTLSLEIVGAGADSAKRRYVNIDGALAAP